MLRYIDIRLPDDFFSVFENDPQLGIVQCYGYDLSTNIEHEREFMDPFLKITGYICKRRKQKISDSMSGYPVSCLEPVFKKLPDDTGIFREGNDRPTYISGRKDSELVTDLPGASSGIGHRYDCSKIIVFIFFQTVEYIECSCSSSDRGYVYGHLKKFAFTENSTTIIGVFMVLSTKKHLSCNYICMNTKLSRLSAGIIVLFAVFGMIAASQAMATTAISTKQTNILVVSPAIQSKINAFIVKLKAKRVNHSSDDSWNRYLDGKIEQIDIIRPKYPQAAAILNALAIGIKSLKEQPSDDLNVEDILSDADTLPSLPFCAQPPMPVCSAGMSCIQSFPQPKTYMNHTDWKKDQAKYLYSGICKSIPPICPNYAAPLAGWCKGTVVPQGKDANGCQLPPKCELTASGVQFFGMKDIYDIGEKIDISVKNAGMKDFSFYGTCGLNYKITNLNGRQLQLNNPMISFDCMQGGVPSIIKAGETRSLGSWDQKEWRESGGMVADNFQTYQV